MKNRAFKWTSALLALVFVLTLMPISAVSKTKTNTYPTKTVTASHVVDFNDTGVDHKTSYPYSDAYLTRSGYEYHDDLAMASMGMQYAAASSQDAKHAGDTKHEDKNWGALMKQMGFQQWESNEWMKKLPSTDSIGICIANKNITDSKGPSTVIAVGIRGANYRGEWGGNGRLDKTGDHKGFALCRDQILSFIKQYVGKRNISGRIKLWISGYSRAAAASNLVGGAVDNGYDFGNGTKLALDDLYCYCFECPKGAVTSEVKDKKYDNIHNIVNPADLVPYAGMKDWDFCRYGIDHVIPTKEDANYKEYDAAMEKYLGTIYNDVDNKNPADKIQLNTSFKQFYDTFMTDVCNAIGSRAAYVDNLQEPVIQALYTYYAAEDYGGDNALNDHLTKALQDHAGEILLAALNPTQNAVDTAIQAVLTDMQKAGMTDMTLDQVKTLLKNLFPVVIKMAASDPNTLMTMLSNANSVSQSHSQCVTESWLRTLPVGYLASHTAHSA